MLFEVVLQGQYFGQEIINRWNYLSTSVPAAVTPSFGLASGFGGIPDPVDSTFPVGSVMRALEAALSTEFQFISLTVNNIYDLSDFYSIPYAPGQNGTNGTGDAMPPINAYGLKSSRVTRAVRAGHKRFAGVNEGEVDPGGVLTAAALTLIGDIATAMNANATYDDEGTTLTYIPCVVSKLKYTTPSGKTAYKYYPTLAEQVPAHVAQAPIWSVMPDVRSQTSRQYGKGK